MNRSKSFSLLSTAIAICLASVAIIVAKPAKAANSAFYVDCVSGSDSNSGSAPDQAWQTVSPVNSYGFQAGDTIYLKRGCSWSDGITLFNSGEEGNPITLTAYGSGAMPIIRNPGSSSNYTNAITLYADWIVVENLSMQDASFSGLYMWTNANHNVIRGIEATNVGIGVVSYGEYNLVTDSYVHDLNIIRDTPESDDDFGAVGVWLFGSHNEVSYNHFVNCKAPCQDYQLDGGAVEIGAGSGTVEDIQIHHNWAEESEGFFEIGSSGGAARDVTLFYNVSVNNGWFSMINLDGQYGTDVSNMRVENNTVWQHQPHAGWGADKLFYHEDLVTPDTLLVRNNIFSVSGWDIAWNPGFTHDHNLYDLGAGDELGFSLDVAESIGAPGFIDGAGGDFHLQSNSSAIDAGTSLGYWLDFEGYPVPAGAAPDVGAFEYASLASPTNTPTLLPTSTPTLLPTSTPTLLPTSTPTLLPTNTPTTLPTSTPTTPPTSTPTTLPTSTPTTPPTNTPTMLPTSTPITPPTNTPTTLPTNTSTPQLTNTSTPLPTSTPTTLPTSTSTPLPTSTPTTLPTSTSTPLPTSTPTTPPTTVPPTPTPVVQPADFVVDNVDPGFSTASQQDNWQQYVELSDQHYGGSHSYNRQLSTGVDVATWSFQAPQPGRYEIYAWWYEGNWRPIDVPYSVHHLGGITVVRMNQQINGGQWNLLGTFEFKDSGSVGVSDAASSGQDVVADAIRLSYVGPLSSTATPEPIYTPLPSSTVTTTPHPTSSPPGGAEKIYLPLILDTR